MNHIMDVTRGVRARVSINTSTRKPAAAPTSQPTVIIKMTITYIVECELVFGVSLPCFLFTVYYNPYFVLCFLVHFNLILICLLCFQSNACVIVHLLKLLPIYVLRFFHFLWILLGINMPIILSKFEF